MTIPCILATDLDGTFIPLPGKPANREALNTLAEVFSRPDRILIYASGRHCASIETAIATVPLPTPAWIVADVGVSIHRFRADRFESLGAYEAHLREQTGGMLPSDAESYFRDLHGLVRQPDAQQGTFKLSYDCAPEDLATLLDALTTILRGKRLPFACTGSVDPDGATGLIDILPAGASKHTALLWLAQYVGIDPADMIYAGDSGNDRAALVSGWRAILVGNAPEELARQVSTALSARDQLDRFYHASAHATSGVLEGCRHFGLA